MLTELHVAVEYSLLPPGGHRKVAVIGLEIITIQVVLSAMHNSNWQTGVVILIWVSVFSTSKFAFDIPSSDTTFEGNVRKPKFG